MNYLSILRMVLFQNSYSRVVHYFFLQSQTLLFHILDSWLKEKFPIPPSHCCSQNHTSPLCLSCAACWLAQLKYWDCGLSCSQTTEVSEQSLPWQPAGPPAPWLVLKIAGNTIPKHISLATASNGSKEWSRGSNTALGCAKCQTSIYQTMKHKDTTVQHHISTCALTQKLGGSWTVQFWPNWALSSFILHIFTATVN